MLFCGDDHLSLFWNINQLNILNGTKEFGNLGHGFVRGSIAIFCVTRHFVQIHKLNEYKNVDTWWLNCHWFNLQPSIQILDLYLCPTIISSLPSTAQVTRARSRKTADKEKKKYWLPKNDWFVKKRKIPLPQTTVENTGSVTRGLRNEELKPDWWCPGHARGSSWPTGAPEVSIWSFVEVREEVVDVIVLIWHVSGCYLRKAFFCPLAYLSLRHFTDSAIYMSWVLCNNDKGNWL